MPLAEFALTGALHFVKGVPELRRQQRPGTGSGTPPGSWPASARWSSASAASAARSPRRSPRWAWRSGAWAGRAGPTTSPGLSRVIIAGGLDAALPGTDIVVLACPLTDETAGPDRRPPAEPAAARRHPDQHLPRAGGRPGRPDRAPCKTATWAAPAWTSSPTEPLPPDDPLWELDNVLVSPHSASTVATENAALTDLFLDNLARLAAGQPLRNRYDPARGY